MPSTDRVSEVPMLINGAWVAGEAMVDIKDPFSGAVVSRAPESSQQDLDDALDAAVNAKSIVAAIPAFERAEILRTANTLLGERAEAIAIEMVRETGKAYRDALGEVMRSRDTISLSAEEAIRIEGEHVPLDGSAMGAGKIAMLLRFPVGVVAGITPFNAPFNLACHKVAPSFAAGNSTVLKCPPQAPSTVHQLVKLFHDAGIPKGALNSLYGDFAGPALVQDPRVDFITFTGSSAAGARIRAYAGLRRVALELGGAGQTIVCDDADVEAVAPLCARSAMRLAGQSCISVQNVYVHASVHDAFLKQMVEEVAKLKTANPMDPDTDVGTLIDETAAKRVESWVQEAVAAGAQIMIGGKRNGAQYTPTILSKVTADMKVSCEEVFGPVVSVRQFVELDDVFDEISESRFGLQCGIFTRSMETGIRAVRNIRTGGVILNGTSTWRTDQLAYGGVKDSGIGREGPRYAIRDMTEERLMLFNM